MKTIIVPTDFSPLAINAMQYAIAMAQEIKTSITLLHVYELPISYTGTEIPMPIIDVAELEEINKEKMAEAKRQVEHISSGSLTINSELKMGDLLEELKALCEEIQPFAVVMGTKGAGFVERLFMGSSTLSAIRHLTTPVIVVPPGAGFRGIKKIGFACDFKSVVETTPANLIKEWVSVFDAELDVLNVDHQHKNQQQESPEESALLHSLLKEATPKYFFIDNENVEKGISEFAESNNVDLIIVVPRKQRLLDTLFQKSHTAEFAFHSHIPILAMHEED